MLICYTSLDEQDDVVRDERIVAADVQRLFEGLIYRCIERHVTPRVKRENHDEAVAVVFGLHSLLPMNAPTAARHT